MYPNDDTFELEILGAEISDIILETNATICKVCGTGSVVSVNSNKEDDKFMIYTRDGTLLARHREHRCNNRSLPCRAGHYHGYVSLGEKTNADKPRCYEKYVLKNKYLFTSNLLSLLTIFGIVYYRKSLATPPLSHLLKSTTTCISPTFQQMSCFAE